jgi:hypothetical protein
MYYGYYLLDCYHVITELELCLNSAEFRPRRKKLKGYQKNKRK